MKTKLWFLAAAFFAAILAGCGDDHDEHVVTGPGFVAIDDSSANTAPRLNVTFTDNVFVRHTVDILSDLQSDGDIARDPVSGALTVTPGSGINFFGVDSLNVNFPEYRAFLTFPLDGVTGQPVVPGTATIDSAFVEVFIAGVAFAPVIPTSLDLVEYAFRSLQPADYSAFPIASQFLDFFSTDIGIFVQIDVTPLMQTAQALALLDFQLRFALDPTVFGLMSAAPGPKAGRTVHAGPRALDNVVSDRGASSTRILTQKNLASRHR